MGEDDVVFLGVGSLAPVKRFDRLPRALVAMGKHEGSPSVEGTSCLWIAGDGPCRSELEALAGALGVADRVRWLGVCDDVPSLLAASDVFVCSSDSEELSNALLEAMAAGLPVVTTDVGDHAEVVGGRAIRVRGDTHPVAIASGFVSPPQGEPRAVLLYAKRQGSARAETNRGTKFHDANPIGTPLNHNTAAGLVVPVGDEAALSRAMGELAINADLRHRLGEAAARRAGDFTFDAMVRGYAALYRRLTGATGRTATSRDRVGHSDRTAADRIWLPA